MATTPGLLDQIKSTGSAVLDALRSRYLAGPPQGAPSAGPGSVLDQKNTQLQPLLPPAQPLVPAQPLMTAQPELTNAQGAYGTGPGEKRIDVTPYLGGLSGVKRK